VLLDDDFSSIVRAMRLGRHIYDNISKAMAYVLSIHVPIAGVSLVPAVLGWPLVLMPVHVIFMELIVDPACSIAFEMEPEEGDVMRRPPRDPRRKLFNRRFVVRNLTQGVGAAVVTLAVLVGARLWGADAFHVRTLTFTTLIMTNLMLIVTNVSLGRRFAEGRKGQNAAFIWLGAAALTALCTVLFAPQARELFLLASPRAADFVVWAGAGLAAFGWMAIVKRYA
jgi:Ca2+-transporting ATPase